MILIKILGTLYLTIGTIYGFYILYKETDKWFMLPINVALGPIFIIYIIYLTLRGKRLPITWH